MLPEDQNEDGIIRWRRFLGGKTPEETAELLGLELWEVKELEEKGDRSGRTGQIC